ncbi:MAG: glycosyltransferase [Planctomycetota bacterium]
MRQRESNELPRILLLIHSMVGGGSERQMSYLATACADRYRTTLLTLDSPKPEDYPIDPRVQRIGLGMTDERGGFLRGALANRRRIVELRRRAMEIQPSLLLSFCDTNNILAGMALGDRMPVVVCERSDPRRQRLSRIWEFLRDRSYPRAAAIVSQTEGVTNYFRHRLGTRAPQRMRTIPSAVQVPSLDYDRMEQDRQQIFPKRILMVGRLSKEKRIDRLLEAWARMASQNPDWIVRIVGDGIERASLESHATGLGIRDRVQFAGWSNDVWSEYARAHAFVLSSEYEGFPQALIEAMLCRVPVIAWNCSDAVEELLGADSRFSDDEIGSVANTLGAKRAGWIVESVDALHRAIQIVVSDEAQRGGVAERGSRRASSYRWDAVAPRWFDLLDELIADTTRP